MRIILVDNRIVCHEIVFVHYLHPITDVKLHETSLADHCLSTVLVSILCSYFGSWSTLNYDITKKGGYLLSCCSFSPDL